MARLSLQKIFKRYEDAPRNFFGKQIKVNEYAVKNLSFECKDRSFAGILGPSGCGKSTTLRMIAGLEEISGGKMFIDDLCINNLRPKDRHIGLAFEDYALYPPLTVYDNLAFNLKARGVKAPEIKKAIDRVAPLLKVEDLLKMKPSVLSGGQKQRVNIARAIIRQPSLLLLDEPLSHLDGKMRQTLRQEIKRMHREIECTTIIVTHDQIEAMSLADMIIIMKDGELQQVGTPLEVYDDPINEFVAGFIGDPPMNLLHAVIAKNQDGFFFTFAGSDLRVQAPNRYNHLIRDGMELILGVRPMDVLITGKTSGAPAPVSIYENFGDECRISIKVGGEYLNLTAAADVVYQHGDLIHLEFKAEKTHLFSTETGMAVK